MLSIICYFSLFIPTLIYFRLLSISLFFPLYPLIDLFSFIFLFVFRVSTYSELLKITERPVGSTRHL